MYRDETSKQKQTTLIIRVCAIILVVFFFVLPLVRCTYEPELTVTGWNMASGTGEVYEIFSNHLRVVPALFIFLIIPLALAIVTFLSIRPLVKYYLIQTVLATAGVLAKLYFIMEMSGRIRRAVGVESTGFHWLILLIYVGVAVLAGVAYYSNKQVTTGYGGGRVYPPDDGFYRGGASGGTPHPPEDGFYSGGGSDGTPYPPEDAFCTRCGSPLDGGLPCRCSVPPREDYSHSYRAEKAFCTQCGSPLHGGMPCSCVSVADDFDSTVLVRPVSCKNCGRELYVDEECSCSPSKSQPFCRECGKKLHAYDKCDCLGRSMSGSKLKNTMKKKHTEPRNRESFGKGGEL